MYASDILPTAWMYGLISDAPRAQFKPMLFREDAEIVYEYKCTHCMTNSILD